MQSEAVFQMLFQSAHEQMEAVMTDVTDSIAHVVAGKIGSADVPQLFTWGQWGRTVKVDVAQAKAYAQAVYASAREYIATLTPAQVGEVVDLTQMGLGQMPRAALLNIALQQVLSHSGEISALKGLQGLKGYAQ
jgi:hypothetical protein